KDLQIIDYKSAWDYQEELVNKNREIKSAVREQSMINSQWSIEDNILNTTNYLLFCEHYPVYTLGKSGSMRNVLLSEEEMEQKEIEFFRTNRGGDITFHGFQQVVG